jgi:hypothetical protein
MELNIRKPFMRAVLIVLVLSVSVPCFAEPMSEDCAVYGHLAGVTMWMKNKGDTRDDVTLSLLAHLNSEEGQQDVKPEAVAGLVEFVGRVYDDEDNVGTPPAVADRKYVLECARRLNEEPSK